MATTRRLTFPKTLRVTRTADFSRAYALRKRRDAGFAVVYGAPNGGPLPRLGLSVGRVVGGAPVRNAFKRLLREAFRLEQQSIPAGLDLIVVVRPHAPRALEDYRALLVRSASELASVVGTGS